VWLVAAPAAQAPLPWTHFQQRERVQAQGPRVRVIGACVASAVDEKWSAELELAVASADDGCMRVLVAGLAADSHASMWLTQEIVSQSWPRWPRWPRCPCGCVQEKVASLDRYETHQPLKLLKPMRRFRQSRLAPANPACLPHKPYIATFSYMSSPVPSCTVLPPHCVL
jgi:hypothetical protein